MSNFCHNFCSWEVQEAELIEQLFFVPNADDCFSLHRTVSHATDQSADHPAPMSMPLHVPLKTQDAAMKASIYSSDFKNNPKRNHLEISNGSILPRVGLQRARSSDSDDETEAAEITDGAEEEAAVGKQQQAVPSLGAPLRCLPPRAPPPAESETLCSEASAALGLAMLGEAWNARRTVNGRHGSNIADRAPPSRRPIR